MKPSAPIAAPYSFPRPDFGELPSGLSLRVEDSRAVLRERARARAFTLIELLVVIGIILILIGLFFGGAKLVTAQAKERQTRTMLETCVTMFDNYKQATNLSRAPMVIPVSRAKIQWCNLNGPSSVPQDFWTLCQVDAPDPSHIPSASLGSHTYTLPNPSTMDPAFLDSICVMYTLESIPENKTIINNLPATDVLNVVFPANGTSGVPAGTQMSVTLLLDGWGNPILFIPGGGFGYYHPNSSSGSFPYSVPGVVCLDGTYYGVVTSAGVITDSGPTFINSPAAVYASTYDPVILSAAGTLLTAQPFFVSAGPDGDFSNAHGYTVTSTPPLPNSSMTDDNIYSFK